MQKNLSTQLQNYLDGRGVFENYLGIKNIIVTAFFQENLKKILTELSNTNEKIAKDFELYLQTIIVNMDTKITKYKKSIFFDNENIKQIENQGYLITFYIDNKSYVLLGITKDTSLNVV